MDIEQRKKEIINIISRIENEILIKKLEKAIRNLNKDKVSLSGLLKPPQEKLDIDKMMKEQDFRGINRDKFEKLTKEIDLRDDIENLLSEI